MTIAVLNPATEETIAELERAGVEETDAAVARAKAAFPAWRAVSPQDRARLLRRLATLVEEHTAHKRMGKAVVVTANLIDEPGSNRCVDRGKHRLLVLVDDRHENSEIEITTDNRRDSQHVASHVVEPIEPIRNAGRPFASTESENCTYTESFAQLFATALPRSQRRYGLPASALNVNST